jgi:hypothetical protein
LPLKAAVSIRRWLLLCIGGFCQQHTVEKQENPQILIQEYEGQISAKQQIPVTVYVQSQRLITAATLNLIRNFYDEPKPT